MPDARRHKAPDDVAGGQRDFDLPDLEFTYRIGIHGVRSPRSKTAVRCTDARQVQAYRFEPGFS